MNAGEVIRMARARAGLTLRALATRAGTSHSTIAAYEAGTKIPTCDTLDRIVRAAGFTLDWELSPRIRGDERLDPGTELAAVLELAAEFPSRPSPSLDMPVFGR